jgi:DNA-directed RNA polymerase specialized sigma24 family protein
MTDFHEIYIRYVGDIYRFSLYLCGNAEDAEDITAETFARALTGKAPLPQSKAICSLLRGICISSRFDVENGLRTFRRIFRIRARISNM